MLKEKQPDLLFMPGSYVQDWGICFEDLCPFQFPFGRGGTNEKRVTKVSKEEQLRHFGRIAKPALHRADFILKRYNAFCRAVSFRSGIMYANKFLHSKDFSADIFKLTSNDVLNAYKKKDLLKQKQKVRNVKLA